MNFIHNLLFTSIFALLIFTSAQAQDAKKVKIGIHGSGNLTWLKPNNDGGYGYENAGMKLGYSAGIMMDFSLFGSENYAFGTGVDLMYHAGKLTYPDVVIPDANIDTFYTGTTTATYSLRYIDIPLTLKLKTNEIGYLTYYGQVGFGLGINIKARQNWKQEYDNGSFEPIDQDVNVSSQIALFRVPLIIGAGVEYNLSGNTSLMLGVVFNNGFTNVFTNKAALYEVESNGKTIKLDENNTPIKVNDESKVFGGKKRNALTNYFGLNVGILF